MRLAQGHTASEYQGDGSPLFLGSVAVEKWCSERKGSPNPMAIALTLLPTGVGSSRWQDSSSVTHEDTTASSWQLAISISTPSMCHILETHVEETEFLMQGTCRPVDSRAVHRLCCEAPLVPRERVGAKD